MRTRLCILLTLLAVTMVRAADPPAFEAVQPDLFAAPGAMTNAWADFDNDEDLDLFVGFQFNAANRLYRNDGGSFVDVARETGIADLDDTRGAAWGDFDRDGDVDLLAGLANPRAPVRLYRNDRTGAGNRFVDVAAASGIVAAGTTRQVSWIDVDTDGDLDLFIAFRGSRNLLFRNDGGRFTEVGQAMGAGDPRRTVGAAWFDFDEDGDLDAFIANQDGDANGFLRNDRTTFVDIAKELGVDAGGRGPMRGSVGPCIGDYDGDGKLDLFVANYGPSFLFRNLGGRFTDVASSLGLAVDQHNDACAWGDFDHDGRPDLYVSAFFGGRLHYPDYLYQNQGAGFANVLPEIMREHDADHGVQWADFDRDGDLDLALADTSQRGNHYLFRNMLPPAAAGRSVQVMVVDMEGRYTRAGSEVRAYRAGTRQLLGTGIVDTGSGYDTQNAAPVHIGLASTDRIDIEVTSLRGYERRTTRRANVDPSARPGRWITIRVP